MTHIYFLTQRCWGTVWRFDERPCIGLQRCFVGKYLSPDISVSDMVGIRREHGRDSCK